MRLRRSRIEILLLLISAIMSGCDQFGTQNLGGPGSVRTTKLGGPATIPQEMRDRGYLGVRLASDPGSDVKTVVVAVIRGAAAELAGIQAGDVILKVDGAAIKDRDDFVSLAKSWKPGQVISLELERNGSNVQCQARLTSFDDYLPLMQAAGE
jgi:S1-C subfamily serine protease